MRWEWDPAKNRSNLAKHGLDFEDAEQALAGNCLTVEDCRSDYGEDRLVAVGLLKGRAIVIAYALRGEATRIISMRKANRREQEIYQKRFGKS
ncbi:MAG: BrnT family toxin [Bryobacteraceae bacterium]|jgi:uncharacterized DUF497 family protein